MTDQERNQVLKMIEDGKISPEEGLKLLQALEQSPEEETVQKSQVPPIPAGSAIPPVPPVAPVTPVPPVPPAGQVIERSNMETDPRITSIKAAVERLWQIPLWIGIVITVLSAIGMFLIMRGPGFNFWFYFMILPLLLGVLITMLAVGVHKAHWLFVDIQEKSKTDGRPHRIFFGFPLPLRFATWFMKTFGRWIPEIKSEYSGVKIDQLIDMFEAGIRNEPLVVNVDEGEDGDKVKVYIG